MFYFFLKFLTILLLITQLIEASELSESDARWTYKCVKNTKCIRVHSDEDVKVQLYESLNACRLICGRYGGLWPRPTGSTVLTQQLTQFNPNFVRFDLQSIPVAAKNYSNEITRLFIDNILKECGPYCTQPSDTDVLIKLFANKNDMTLSWTTDESYSLDIDNLGTKVTIQVSGETIYGVRHGLETLSQLITQRTGPPGSDRSGLFIVSAARIRDRPIYPHRGFMLDTARNFIPIEDIERTLDGMAASKLNVFHWHATDSQSFPLEVPRVPQMTRYGAYSENHIYKQADIKHIVQYAKYRGIRTIIELDAPSHAGNGWQWGPSYNLGELAVCVNQQPWRNYCIQPPCGQLNPTNPNLYRVIRDIYRDLIDVTSPDETIHMGGDEVYFPCWNSSIEIINLLTSRGHQRTETDFLQLWAEYQVTSLRIWDEESGHAPSSRDQRKKPNPVILWSSHLTKAEHIEKYLEKDRYIIQTWVESSNNLPVDLITKGYQVILSTKDAWYLDHGFWGNTQYHSWRIAYKNRIPRSSKVLGGEACMWTELVDENSLDARIWPRTSAVAERLWSDPETDAIQAESRFYRHRQRLISRGLQPEAVAPKWCTQNEGECY